MSRVGRVERAAKAVLEAVGAPGSEVLAELLLLLARRMDENPGARDATALSRELRLVTADLRGMTGRGAEEVERFLAGISAEGFRHG